MSLEVPEPALLINFMQQGYMKTPTDWSNSISCIKVLINKSNDGVHPRTTYFQPVIAAYQLVVHFQSR